MLLLLSVSCEQLQQLKATRDSGVCKEAPPKQKTLGKIGCQRRQI